MSEMKAILLTSSLLFWAGGAAEFQFPPFEFFDKDNNGRLVATEVGQTVVESVGSAIIKLYGNTYDEIDCRDYEAMREEFILAYREVRSAVDGIGRAIGPLLRRFGSDPCKKIFHWFDHDGNGYIDKWERSRGGIYLNNKGQVGLEEFEKTLIDFDLC